MKAAWYEEYGEAEVVQWGEVPLPRLRGGDVLVRVEAAALNPKDVLVRKGKYRVLSGAKFPKCIGLDLVGQVVERGWRAPPRLANRRVFGFFGGLRALRGSVAELTAIPAAHVTILPEHVDASVAAATPLAGSTALQSLRDDARLARGEHVFVVGASGGVGTFAVQIAKLLGARVSASTSARNADFVRALGADEVFDYASERPLGRGPYDVVLDCFGRVRAGQLGSVLARGGRFVSLVPSLGIAAGVARGALLGPRTRLTNVWPRRRDLDQLALWLAGGQLRAEIDRVCTPDRVVDAMRHLETRHARGKIVIRMT